MFSYDLWKKYRYDEGQGYFKDAFNLQFFGGGSFFDGYCYFIMEASQKYNAKAIAKFEDILYEL